MKKQEEKQAVSNDKKYFESIPVEERSSWLENMLKTKQLEGAPKHIFKSNYESTGQFNFQGTKIHYYYQQQSEEPSGLVFVLHGLNGHGGYTGYFGVNLAKGVKDVNVYALDFKNYGKSGGNQKGLMPPFEDSVAQAEGFVDHILEQYKNKPKLYLAGESFGGTISFKMAIDKPEKYAGLIFLSGAIRQLKKADYYLKKVGNAFGYFFPKLKILPPDYTTDSKYFMADLIKSDQNIYQGKMAAGSFKVCLKAMESIESQFSKLKTPYILFQAGVDKLIDPFAALDLENECQVKDKTTIYFKYMWHNIFFEEEIEQVVEMTVDWLKKRL